MINSPSFALAQVAQITQLLPVIFLRAFAASWLSELSGYGEARSDPPAWALGRAGPNPSLTAKAPRQVGSGALRARAQRTVLSGMGKRESAGKSANT